MVEIAKNFNLFTLDWSHINQKFLWEKLVKYILFMKRTVNKICNHLKIELNILNRAGVYMCGFN